MTFSDLETCTISVAEGIFDDIFSVYSLTNVADVDRDFYYPVLLLSLAVLLANWVIFWINNHYSFHSPKHKENRYSCLYLRR